MIRRLVFLLAAAALVAPVAALGFAPTDPLSAKQWYLTQIHAFDFWPDVPPTLAPVRVAVVDSGLDLGHPEFAGRVALARSFVGGDAVDRQGHGTFVAGIIAANADNNEGITGIALSAQLLIAKVVRPDGTISPIAEARAIRWAVDHGARDQPRSAGCATRSIPTRTPIRRPSSRRSPMPTRRAPSWSRRSGTPTRRRTPWHYAAGGPAARHRCERSCRGRLGAGLLDPGQGVQRHRRSRRRDRLDPPAFPDRWPPVLRRAGVLALRAARVPVR